MSVGQPKVSERQTASSGQAQRDIQAALAAWAVSSTADPVESNLPFHTGDRVPTKSLKEVRSGFHRGVLYLLQKNKFKKYLFVLQKPYLFYFKTRTVERMAGGFDLRLYSKQITASSQRKHSIRLTNSRQTLQVVLAATSEAEASAWIEMLAFTFDELENELTGAGTTSAGLSISKPMFVKSTKDDASSSSATSALSLPMDALSSLSSSSSSSSSSSTSPSTSSGSLSVSTSASSLAGLGGPSPRRRTGSYSAIVRSNDMRLLAGGELSLVGVDETAPSSTKDDLVELDSYSMGALASALLTRYHERHYYTNCSQVLLALEPQRLEAQTFSHQRQQRYREAHLSAQPLPPHPYSAANAAYHSAMQNARSTSLHFGGPAQHKSHTFDLVLDYLLSMPRGRRSVVSGSASDVIKHAQTVLGALTRRKTPNQTDAQCSITSVTVAFSSNGEAAGGKVHCRLLNHELSSKSPPPGCQNFHVFYSLIADSRAVRRCSLPSADAAAYPSLRPTQPVSLPAKYALDSLYVALAALGFDEAQSNELFGVLAAILHLLAIRAEDLQSKAPPLQPRGSRIFRPGTAEATAILSAQQTSSYAFNRSKPTQNSGSFGGAATSSLASASLLLGVKSSVLRRLLLERGSAELAAQAQALAGSIYRRLVAWLIGVINAKMVPPAHSVRVTLIDWPTFSTSTGAEFVGHDLHTLFRHTATELSADLFRRKTCTDELALMRAQRVLLPNVKFPADKILADLLPSRATRRSLLGLLVDLSSSSSSSSSASASSSSSSSSSSSPSSSSPSSSSSSSLVQLPPPPRLVKQIVGELPLLQTAGPVGSFKITHGNKIEYVYDAASMLRSLRLGIVDPLAGLRDDKESRNATVRSLVALDVPSPQRGWLQDLEALEKSAKSASYFVLFFAKQSSPDPSLIIAQMEPFQISGYLNLRAKSYDTRLTFQEFVGRYGLLWHDSGAGEQEPAEQSVRYLRSLAPAFRGGERKILASQQRLCTLQQVLDHLHKAVASDAAVSALTVDASKLDGASVCDTLRFLLGAVPPAFQERTLEPLLPDSGQSYLAPDDDDGAVPHMWQDGSELLFLDVPLIDYLEARRLEKMNAAAARIQRAWRHWINRCIFLDLLHSIRMLHKYILGWVHRRRYRKLRAAVVQLQARRRMVVQRRAFLAVRNDPAHVEARDKALAQAFRQAKLAVAALKRDESRSKSQLDLIASAEAASSSNSNSDDDGRAKTLAEKIRDAAYCERLRRYLALEHSEAVLDFYLANEALIRIKEPSSVFASIRDMYVSYVADEKVLGIAADEQQAIARQVYSLQGPPLHIYCALATRVLADIESAAARFESSAVKPAGSRISAVARQPTMTGLRRGMTRSNLHVDDVSRMAELSKQQVQISFLSQEESDRLRAMDELLEKQTRTDLENMFSNGDKTASTTSPVSSPRDSSSGTSPRDSSSGASPREPAATPGRRLLAEQQRETVATRATVDLAVVLAALQPDETFDSYVRANCQRHMVTDLGGRRPISWTELAHPQTTPLGDAMHPFGNRKKKAARDFESRALVDGASATLNPFAAMDELDELYMQMAKEGFDVDAVSSKEIDANWKAVEAKMEERARKLRQQRNAPRNMKEEQAEKRTRVALFMFNSIVYLQTAASDKDSVPIKSIAFFQRNMVNEPELCDEIYCQLIKQTRAGRDNSTESNKQFVLRGWQILTILCGLVPPSPKFVKYLVWHLEHYRHGEQTSAAGAVRRQWAQFGYDRLSRLLANGPRNDPPGPTEFESLLRCQPFFLLRVHTADGHIKAVPIDSSTTLSEIYGTLLDKLHLQSVAGWALFEVINDLERVVLKTEKIGDELAKLEQLHGHWDQTKLTDEHGQDAGLRFVFKRHLHLEPRYLSNDPVENSLLFAQFSQEYLRGLVPLKTSEALKLAAIKLQYDAGDYNAARVQEMMAEARAAAARARTEAGIFNEEPDEPTIIDVSAYLPSSLLSSSEQLDIEWQTDIFRLYETLQGITKDQAKGLFLKTISETALFGSKTFPVAHKSTWDMPSDILLGVSIEGLTFINPATFEIYVQYPLAAVHRISSTRHSVEILVDNLSSLAELAAKNGYVVAGPSGQCLKQDTFVLTTREGQPIRWLVNAYIDWLKVESRVGMAKSAFESNNPKYLSIGARELLRAHDRQAEWCVCESLVRPGVRGLVRTELVRFVPEVPDDFFSSAAGSRKVVRAAERPKLATPLDTSDAPSATAGALFDVSTRFATQKLTGVDSSKFTMQSFATRKFRTATAARTLGLSGKQTLKTLNLESRLTFSSNTIRDSLLNFTSEAYTNDSAQTFEKIMAFMGDTRKRRGQTELSLLQDVVQTVLRSRPLRDEILCQCIKQTTDNPNPASAERGWLLMCFCLAVFLPTKDFGRYLIAYLQEHAQLDGPLARIGSLAREAMVRLGRTLQKGARKHPPSAWEYEAVCKGAPLLARIELLDGSVKTVIIDQACTVGEILQDVFSKLDLPEDEHQNLDVYMECKEIDYFKRLTVDDNYCDAIYLTEHHPKSTPALKWSFVLRHSILFTWGGALDPRALASPMSLHLLFYQAVADIHDGYRQLSVDEVVAFGALHLQAVLGPVSPAVAASRQIPQWQTYVPARFAATTTTAAAWGEALTAAWAALGQLGQREARENYILKAQESPFFGAVYWKVKRDTKPYDAVLGLSCRCLFLVNPDTYAPVPRSIWGFLNILTWRYSPAYLSLEVGDPNDVTDKRTVVFYSDQGEAIYKLLDRYFDKIMNFCRSNAGVNLQVETGAQALAVQSASPAAQSLAAPPGLSSSQSSSSKKPRPHSELSASTGSKPRSSTQTDTASPLAKSSPRRPANPFGATSRSRKT